MQNVLLSYDSRMALLDDSFPRSLGGRGKLTVGEMMRYEYEFLIISNLSSFSLI